MGGPRLKGTTLEEKLMLNSVVNDSGCRIWERAKDDLGYGKIPHNGKQRLVHRLAFELWVEPLGDKMFVCHRCDVPSCLEPTHLFQGTNQENMDDKGQKGRQAKLKGVLNGNSAFCDYDIREMRALYSAGFGQAELGRMYDVSRGTINDIVKRRRWKHLTEESV
jgi:hypothetical protein